MSCGVTEFIRGGVLQEPSIIKPEVSGGAFQSPEIDSPSVGGAVTLSQTALDSLASQLNPVIEPVLDRDAVAAVFKDSVSGLPLVPDVSLVTPAGL